MRGEEVKLTSAEQFKKASSPPCGGEAYRIKVTVEDRQRGRKVAKQPKNHGQHWTKKDTLQIGILARKGFDTDDIAKTLGRTKDAIYSRASEEGISVRPKDKPEK